MTEKHDRHYLKRYEEKYSEIKFITMIIFSLKVCHANKIPGEPLSLVALYLTLGSTKAHAHRSKFKTGMFLESLTSIA